MTASPTAVWLEYSSGTCSVLNTSVALLLTGEAAVVEEAKSVIDAACDVVAARGSTTHDVDDVQETSPTSCSSSSLFLLPQLRQLPRVSFSTSRAQAVLQKCVAVYGRLPMFVISDFTKDDEEVAFVMDLHTSSAPSATSSSTAQSSNSGRCGCRCIPPPDGQHLSTTVDEVAAFILRVQRRLEPRARQGASPPPFDVFRPTHGAVLLEGLTATTSSIQRLQRGLSTRPTSSCSSSPASSILWQEAELPAKKAATCCVCTCHGRTHAPASLCVFWTDRCHCCPAVLVLVDTVMMVLRVVMEALPVVLPSGRRLAAPLFITANIDDNELEEFDWPGLKPQRKPGGSDAGGCSDLVVPSIVLFRPPTSSSSCKAITTTTTTTTTTTPSSPHAHRGERIIFEGSRSFITIVEFVFQHAFSMDGLSKDDAAGLAASITHLRSVVQVVVEQLDLEAATQTMRAEDHPLYTKAVEMIGALTDASTAEDVCAATKLAVAARRNIFDFVPALRCTLHAELQRIAEATRGQKSGNGNHIAITTSPTSSPIGGATNEMPDGPDSPQRSCCCVQPFWKKQRCELRDAEGGDGDA